MTFFFFFFFFFFFHGGGAQAPWAPPLDTRLLITDELQFGFKKNASTVLCTSLLMETVEYYNDNDTDCNLLLLDASNAFDRSTIISNGVNLYSTKHRNN